jgi:trans-2,3-dihydro-3-hydroxyanthranilate isomerase
VRIFFPTGEIPFAGHPTVGCAVLLAEAKHKPGCAFETEIRLEEQAGLVPVKVTRVGGRARAMFTAPVVPYPVEASVPTADAAAAATGLSPADIGFEEHQPGLFEGGPRFLYIPVASPRALAASRVSEPAWSAMIEAAGVDAAYLYVKGGERQQTAFRARMYAPHAGIPEDPATGSATAILAAQLLRSGVLSEGTNRFELEQGYEMGRPSNLTLEVDVEGNALKAVRVAGHAVAVMSGELSL